MHPTWLTVFRAVARSGSITAAAQELGYTQSAVSRQIAALEADLGAVLLDRLPRGVRLTEAGHRLLGHAEHILDRMGQARRELSDLDRLRTGRLRFGAIASADAALVPRALAAFRAEHPDVEVTHAEGLSAELIDQVLADDIELAVVSPRHAVDSRVRLRRLLDDPIMVALQRDHRLARRRTLHLAELAGEPWIAGPASPEETLIRAALRTGFAPTVEYVLGEWLAKLGFVAAGLGITLVPALAAGAARSDILLKRLHPDDASVRPIYLATLEGATLSAAAARFTSLLHEVAASLRTDIRARAAAKPADQPSSAAASATSVPASPTDR